MLAALWVGVPSASAAWVEPTPITLDSTAKITNTFPGLIRGENSITLTGTATCSGAAFYGAAEVQSKVKGKTGYYAWQGIPPSWEQGPGTAHPYGTLDCTGTTPVQWSTEIASPGSRYSTGSGSWKPGAAVARVDLREITLVTNPDGSTTQNIDQRVVELPFTIVK